MGRGDNEGGGGNERRALGHVPRRRQALFRRAPRHAAPPRGLLRRRARARHGRGSARSARRCSAAATLSPRSARTRRSRGARRSSGRASCYCARPTCSTSTTGWSWRASRTSRGTTPSTTPWPPCVSVEQQVLLAYVFLQDTPSGSARGLLAGKQLSVALRTEKSILGAGHRVDHRHGGAVLGLRHEQRQRVRLLRAPWDRGALHCRADQGHGRLIAAAADRRPPRLYEGGEQAQTVADARSV
jgi:hypothetical protein